MSDPFKSSTSRLYSFVTTSSKFYYNIIKVRKSLLKKIQQSLDNFIIYKEPNKVQLHSTMEKETILRQIFNDVLYLYMHHIVIQSNLKKYFSFLCACVVARCCYCEQHVTQYVVEYNIQNSKRYRQNKKYVNIIIQSSTVSNRVRYFFQLYFTLRQ